MSEVRVEQLIERVDRDGYCTIPQVFGREEVQKALALVRDWEKRMKAKLAANVPYLNKDTQMVYNLQYKEYYFLELLFSPKDLERILVHFLNDTWYKQIPPGEPNYILRHYLARSSNDALPMHIDSFIPYPGDYPLAMQCMIVLEDLTPENGCTVVVPGSHKSGRYTSCEAFNDALPIEARSGDMFIFDSRLWHGALPNKTKGTRWAVIATFTRWWIKQAFNIPMNLPQRIYEKLTPNQKAILGFCTIPHIDETEGIDLKHGYEALSEKCPAVVRREEAESQRNRFSPEHDQEGFDDFKRMVKWSGKEEQSS